MERPVLTEGGEQRRLDFFASNRQTWPDGLEVRKLLPGANTSIDCLKNESPRQNVSDACHL